MGIFGTHPLDALLPAEDGAGGAGADSRILGEYDQDRRSVFNSEPKAEPVRRGQAIEHARRDVGKIQAEDTEAAAMQEDIGGLQCCAGVVTTADPEQVREDDAACLGGVRIKSIGGVDDGANLAIGGGDG